MILLDIDTPLKCGECKLFNLCEGNNDFRLWYLKRNTDEERYRGCPIKENTLECKEKNRIKYSVVRTYESGTNCEKDLQNAFDDGWQFVRASEYIPESVHDGVRRYGYIEYVLCKGEK